MNISSEKVEILTSLLKENKVGIIVNVQKEIKLILNSNINVLPQVEPKRIDSSEKSLITDKLTSSKRRFRKKTVKAESLPKNSETDKKTTVQDENNQIMNLKLINVGGILSGKFPEQETINLSIGLDGIRYNIPDSSFNIPKSKAGQISDNRNEDIIPYSSLVKIMFDHLVGIDTKFGITLYRKKNEILDNLWVIQSYSFSGIENLAQEIKTMLSKKTQGGTLPKLIVQHKFIAVSSLEENSMMHFVLFGDKMINYYFPTSKFKSKFLAFKAMGSKMDDFKKWVWFEILHFDKNFKTFHLKLSNISSVQIYPFKEENTNYYNMYVSLIEPTFIDSDIIKEKLLYSYKLLFDEQMLDKIKYNLRTVDLKVFSIINIDDNVPKINEKATVPGEESKNPVGRVFTNSKIPNPILTQNSENLQEKKTKG
jgi:hypothetical protein